MKRLTPILNLFHTSDFASEGNPEGKIIDYANPALIKIIPSLSLSNQLKALNGKIIMGDYSTHVFLNLSGNQSENEALLSLLPNKLIFAIVAGKPDVLRYSGLDFSQRLLFLDSPANTEDEYIFNHEFSKFRKFGNGSLISDKNTTEFINAYPTVQKLQKTIGNPIGAKARTYDLKVSSGNTSITIDSGTKMKYLYELLCQKKFDKIDLKFTRTDGILLRDILEILVIDSTLPGNAIGLISLPKSALSIQAGGENMNKFLIHFPAAKSTVTFKLAIAGYESDTTLFLDDQEILNPEIQDHPFLDNFKTISATAINYKLVADKHKAILIRKNKSLTTIPIEPMYHYDFNTKTLNIDISNQFLTLNPSKKWQLAIKHLVRILKR